ncbi:hypothetical protein BH24ACT5_BH24ACT5_09800 [soil metagenome]
MLELPAIVEGFATGFDDLPEIVEGVPSGRMLITSGILVRAAAVFGLATSKATIDLTASRSTSEGGRTNLPGWGTDDAFGIARRRPNAGEDVCACENRPGGERVQPPMVRCLPRDHAERLDGCVLIMKRAQAAWALAWAIDGLATIEVPRRPNTAPGHDDEIGAGFPVSPDDRAPVS